MKPTSPWSCGGRGGRIASPGCLSRILRRILCFRNLPFDHFRANVRESQPAIGATPGVVARLMGLDSIPRLKPVDESPSGSDLGSVDQFKTSRSTLARRRPRDIPPYQELEDDKFFILSFEKRRERKSSRNSRMEEEDSKRERDGLQGKNKENENPENLLLLLNNPCKKREKSKKNTARKYAITFENEADSENSSPNSVLEFVGFSAYQESVSSGEISRLANSKTRRPLSEELENCGDNEENLSNNRNDQKGENLVISRHEHPNYAAKLGGIGKVAAMEVTSSRWLHDEVLTNKHWLLEIGRDVASHIFDHLLEELVINIEQF